MFIKELKEEKINGGLLIGEPLKNNNKRRGSC